MPVWEARAWGSWSSALGAGGNGFGGSGLGRQRFWRLGPRRLGPGCRRLGPRRLGLGGSGRGWGWTRRPRRGHRVWLGDRIRDRGGKGNGHWHRPRGRRPGEAALAGGRLAAHQQDQGKEDQLSHRPWLQGCWQRRSRRSRRGRQCRLPWSRQCHQCDGDGCSARLRIRATTICSRTDCGKAANALMDGRQHFFAFLPLPHGHLSLRRGSFSFRIGCSFMSFSRGCFQSRILRVSVSSV